MAVLTSRKGEGREEKRSQADCTFSQPAGKKSRGGKKEQSVLWGRGGGCCCWGAAQGQLWGQLAAASGEGTKWHLPNLAAGTHLPARHRGHPQHALPSSPASIWADPLPSDLPQEGSCSRRSAKGHPPKFPAGHTSHPREGKLAAMQCMDTTGGRWPGGICPLGRAVWVPLGHLSWGAEAEAAVVTQKQHLKT